MSHIAKALTAAEEDIKSLQRLVAREAVLAPKFSALPAELHAALVTLKEQLASDKVAYLPVSVEEQRDVFRAMGFAAERGGGYGHWFQCPNGHPYVISTLPSL